MNGKGKWYREVRDYLNTNKRIESRFMASLVGKGTTIRMSIAFSLSEIQIDQLLQN